MYGKSAKNQNKNKKTILVLKKSFPYGCIQFKRSFVNMIFKQATFWPNIHLRLNQTKKHL